MERRKFLGLGLAVVATVPTALSAVDFRKVKPDTWTAKTTDTAIKALYGVAPTESADITLNLPKVASNGGAVPVTIKSSIDAKSVALFQDSNPESAVMAVTIPDGGMIDYKVKIKMAKTGTVTVVVEGKDGKVYSKAQKIEVALGGCEG